MRKLAVACVCLLSVSAVLAQAPATPQPQRTVIRAGRLLDVKTGKVLTNQIIVIENDIIASVGGTEPEGANVIDLSNATVLPGLLDMHTHLTYEPTHFGYNMLGISGPRAALTGAKNAKLTLEAGFTTVRNLGALGYADTALAEAIEAGDVPGPRVLASGPSLSITGGHCDNNLLPPEWKSTSAGVADGPEAVREKVRENVKYGATVIKVCATGGVLSRGTDPRTSQYTEEELKMIVSEAHRLGRTVAAHAHGGEGIIWASNAGVDSIEHGSYLDDAGIKVLKKNGTYLVPTLYLMDWFLANAERAGVPPYAIRKGREAMPVAREAFRKAVAQGVKVAFGTDSAVYPHGQNAREFAVYVKLGMTPLAAIQSATINAADLVRWSERVGIIEAGRWADIIAVDGDPLQDVTTLERVKFVMKGGRVYKNDYAVAGR
jgi:imidazolonepropionase-like amidohydrolase